MKRRRFLRLLALVPIPASAHHGWSGFDETKPLYVEGKVKSVKWQNPHAEVVVTMPVDAALPADLAQRAIPPQKAAVDGARVLANARLPVKRGDWTLELAPLHRLEAWKLAQPRPGDTVAAVGYSFKDERGEAFMRVDFYIVGTTLYGLRSMPA
jgi:hypothetical protein